MDEDEEAAFEIDASDSAETEMDQETLTELRNIALVKNKAVSLPSSVLDKDPCKSQKAKNVL